ncbi:hypothetical protein SAMN05660742_10177 [Propionispira arboris]|uniref:MazG nucleotide pyrophosphohydrolase domain-containing protein n=1 Tax=Propionispira arboris TaxID=84035 RepID=A0A1H6TK82_9FIRM|nr:nucleotide pyrophosphohydrolase [Propionispira arboris]SEI79706.1 hypothetical protein SAMN05660742_10177 [Propionispira arboris]
MFNIIGLPKLNKLSPTLYSTLLKIVEESGELARATLTFLPYERLRPDEISELAAARESLAEVNGELLDVAQTCVTMLFVMEENYAIVIDDLIERHLNKLKVKKYAFRQDQVYKLYTENNYKYMSLPKLLLPEVTLLRTVCKIQEEVGELTQYLGKRAGASGEKHVIANKEVLVGSAGELLDIAQCCFTMMYILAEKYDVDIENLIQVHIAKLKVRGYFV